MKNSIGLILEGLHQDRVNEKGYKTIAGVRAKVDSDGKVINEKDKKKIEKRLGTTLDENSINEDEWKTMHGAHILIDSDGDIIAGGPKHMRKKKDKK